jgi:CubicO group peptidase (beta-lactamase class C family)
MKDTGFSAPAGLPVRQRGLASAVDDYLALGQMMLNKGHYGRERILSRSSVELMTIDHLMPGQKAGNGIFFGDNSGWGFSVSVITKRDDLSSVPGKYGWNGSLGTSRPAEDMVAILMTQRTMDSPTPPAFFLDFWTSAYQAIDD